MNPLDSLAGERTAAWLYRRISARERAPQRARLFAELAREAEAQAAHWEARLRAHGVAPPPFRPGARPRLIALLVRALGPAPLAPVLAAMKVRGMSVYRGAEALPSRHDELGERHGRAGGTLRAAVFGANDGLVSNTSLILGVAGATSEPGAVLLAGSAGLIAGAVSMAAGEYVSVRSQRELYEHQIALERAELAEYPEEEAEELALILRARGTEPEAARRQAVALVAEPERALETLAREELGLDPANLGSPVRAALASLLSFSAGAAVPLVPYALARGPLALAASVACAAGALFAVGAAISLFSGRGALAGGTRMLAIGLAAGALTWGIGRALGVAIG